MTPKHAAKQCKARGGQSVGAADGQGAPGRREQIRPLAMLNVLRLRVSYGDFGEADRPRPLKPETLVGTSTSSARENYLRVSRLFFLAVWGIGRGSYN